MLYILQKSNAQRDWSFVNDTLLGIVDGNLSVIGSDEELEDSLITL